MLSVADVGDILSIKAGNESAEGKVFRKGRKPQPSVRSKSYKTGCTAGCREV